MVLVGQLARTFPFIVSTRRRASAIGFKCMKNQSRLKHSSPFDLLELKSSNSLLRLKETLSISVVKLRCICLKDITCIHILAAASNWSDLPSELGWNCKRFAWSPILVGMLKKNKSGKHTNSSRVPLYHPQFQSQVFLVHSINALVQSKNLKSYCRHLMPPLKLKQ